MAQGKLISTLIVMTLSCCLLSVQARPQSFDNDIFPVDGFAFDGPADGDDINTFERTTPQPVTSAPTTSMSVERCMNVCQNTSEYNPVCGTDGVLYSNPGRLGCAQRCGRAVNLANYGRCNSGPARG